MSGKTPMMKQYLEIKSQYKDCILFYRLGDFYEMFYDDAITASKVLGIALTARQDGSTVKAPMCGIPHHAANNYLPKLLKKGFKVAVCEQFGDPKETKGPVERKVVRVLTPGTVVDDSYLVPNENNYIISICEYQNRIGLALSDLSTGNFSVASIVGKEALLNEVAKINPIECVLPEHFDQTILSANHTVNYYINTLPKNLYSIERLTEKLSDKFSNDQLVQSGLNTDPAALLAAGSLYHYLTTTIKASLEHMSTLSRYNPEAYMILDYATRKNLELTKNIHNGSTHTLFSVLDHTKTAGGSRLLRQWIEQPLKSSLAIEARQASIQYFHCEPIVREELRELLKNCYDLERLLAKILYSSADAKMLLHLKETLVVLPQILEVLASKPSNQLKPLIENVDCLEDLASLIDNSIHENPPVGIKDGNIIKDGYHIEIDRLRLLKTNGKTLLANMENMEKERTGIRSLKISYNKVFGYYIEVTKSNLAQVPTDYIRKQTLVNCERYITPELKELEEQIITAEDRLKNLEYQVFDEIRQQALLEIQAIKKTAAALAELDVYACLAYVAERNNYHRPEISDDDVLLIQLGRHPVVEMALRDEFIANDLCMSTNENRLMIITGPNMSGKSTFLRQTAIIVLMAHMGSFVPCNAATIPLTDRIFTRIGASDNLAQGQSTFMVEMQETATILRNATHRSLVLLDEIGRGTSTYDGVSLAWAISEYLYDVIKAKTLFATHYYELTQLQAEHTAVQNYNVEVIEKGEDIIFLHKIHVGSTDRSYGIQVARLAGVPQAVINKARNILNQFENGNKSITSSSFTSEEKLSHELQEQDVIVQTAEEGLLQELRELPLLQMTPLDALNYLFTLQKKIENEK